MSKTTNNTKTLSNLIDVECDTLTATTINATNEIIDSSGYISVDGQLNIPVGSLPLNHAGINDGETIYYNKLLYINDLNTGWNIYAPMLTFSTVPPANPFTGQMYYNTAGNALNIYNGTTWKSTAFA